MLKVLIVDDEPVVREGLKSIIQWEKFGFYICGEAIDGRDGLNKIIELEPNLVLMDIRMPGIHGIELIGEAKKRGFKGKIIILTGYSDFSYAKSAIRLEVNDYLLKPIDEDELIRSVTNISKIIQEDFQLQACVNDYRNNQRNNEIINIISGSEILTDLDGDLKEYNLNFKFHSYQVILFDIDLNKIQASVGNIESDKVLESTDTCIRRSLESHFSKNDDIEIFYYEYRFGLIFKGESNILKPPAILKRLYKEWLVDFGINTFITLGNVVKSIEDISISYLNAKEVLKNKFFYEENILSWEELCIQKATLAEESETKNMSNYIDRIYTFVEINDVDNINTTFNEIDHVFKKINYLPDKLKGLCLNIFIEFKEKVLFNYKDLKDNFSSNDNIVNVIYEQNSLNGLIEYLRGECVAISNKICNSTSDNTMKRILTYIQKNYYKDLKLRLLAEIFNYNSAYLGKMFKNYTGEEFNVYIDKVRIKNAKILLNENDLMVYEVSERVGYKSVDYFYCKFKKYVGVSPKEYKRTYKLND